MKDQNKLKQAKQLLTEHIRQSGKRMTPERTVILEAAYSFDTPFTIDQLKDYILTLYPITRQTIYNNLELFFQIGIVIKRPIGGGAVEYETCFMAQTHHHLVCKTCGQIFEFRDASIEQFLLQKKYKRFQMDKCSVVIYGSCNKCQSRINREQAKAKAIKAKALKK